MQHNTVDNALCGAAGVHFVASELSRRGLVALLTLRNTAGFDILVSTPDGTKHANIQVKTSLKKVDFWPVGTKYKTLKGPHCYYVFVRFNDNENKFEAFLVSSDVVEKALDDQSLIKKANNNKFPPTWYLPKAKEEIEKLKEQWINFYNGV